MLPSTSSFAKHDVSEYPGVLIPLARGTSTSAAPKPRLGSTTDEDAEKKSLGDQSVTGGLPRYSTTTNNNNPTTTLTSTNTGDLESPRTLETLRAEIEDDVALSGVDTPYDRKSHILNKAIADIGMGSYQWQLFVLCGFGWMADNLWLQGVALTLPQLSAEFGVDSNQVRYTTLSLFLGLCIGASFWGIISDIIGRRLAFNFTLFIAGVFGVAAGAAPSWIGVCALYACLGLGVGGSLPVDGALFLEFLPFASGNLLVCSLFSPSFFGTISGRNLGIITPFAWGKRESGADMINRLTDFAIRMVAHRPTDRLAQ
jgi:hypothetical protein